MHGQQRQSDRSDRWPGGHFTRGAGVRFSGRGHLGRPGPSGQEVTGCVLGTLCSCICGAFFIIGSENDQKIISGSFERTNKMEL